MEKCPGAKDGRIEEKSEQKLLDGVKSLVGHERAFKEIYKYLFESLVRRIAYVVGGSAMAYVEEYGTDNQLYDLSSQIVFEVRSLRQERDRLKAELEAIGDEKGEA